MQLPVIDLRVRVGAAAQLAKVTGTVPNQEARVAATSRVSRMWRTI
jgi:hypothetical protein